MVQVARSIRESIIAHAQEEPDREVCGILGGRDGSVERVFRAANLAEDVARRFLMDVADIHRANKALQDHDMDIVGFYHSHTHTEAYPSRTDVEMWQATWHEHAWCFICSLQAFDHPVLRAFRINLTGTIAEEPITVRDDP